MMLENYFATIIQIKSVKIYISSVSCEFMIGLESYVILDRLKKLKHIVWACMTVSLSLWYFVSFHDCEELIEKIG